MSTNYTSLGTMNEHANHLHELAILHAAIAAKGSIATGTGDDRDKQNPSFTVARPWVEPPEGFLSFDESGVLAVPATGAGGVLVSHTAPTGYDGVINAFSWTISSGTGFTDGSGDLVVQIRRNGVPVRNYSRILVQKGSAGMARPISPLRFYSHDTIDIYITHPTATAVTGNVSASLVGYDYPAES